MRGHARGGGSRRRHLCAGRERGQGEQGGWLSSSCQAWAVLPPASRAVRRGRGEEKQGRGFQGRAGGASKGMGAGEGQGSGSSHAPHHLQPQTPERAEGPDLAALRPPSSPSGPGPAVPCPPASLCLVLLCHVPSPLCAWEFQGCKQTPPLPQAGLIVPPPGCPSAASCNRSRSQAVTQLPRVWSPASPGAEAGGETAGEDGALGAAGLGVAEPISVGERPLSTAVPHLDATGLRLEPS